MAKIWASDRKKADVKSNTTTPAGDETTTVVDTKQETVEVKTPDLNSILERLEKVEMENKELKEWKENIHTKWREKLQWPRTFSYKMWAWLPIVKIESFRKDITKDLLYKNQHGVFVSNHYVRLTLANGKDYEVEANDFGRDVSRSEGTQATNQYWQIIDLTNLKQSETYTFKTADFGTITILPSLLN